MCDRPTDCAQPRHATYMPNKQMTNGTTVVRIAQANLQKSVVGVQEIRQAVHDNDVDVVCAQEIHAVDGIAMGFGIGGTIVHAPPKDPHLIAALISVHNSSLKVLNLSQFTNTHCVCVELRHSGESLYLVNVYCQYSEPLESMLHHLDVILSSLPAKRVIILGDFNARSKMWHDRVTDTKGLLLEDFVARHGLFIANMPGSLYTYSHNGESNVDVTLCTGNVLRYIRDWRVRDGWTTCDHRVISLELELDSSTIVPRHTTSRFNICKADINLLEMNVSLNIKRVEEYSHSLSSPARVDEAVRMLQNVIEGGCSLSMPLRVRLDKKPVHWWTAELSEGRAETARLRRKYQRARDPSLRARYFHDYQIQRNAYHNKVRCSKQTSFRRFITSDGNDDPYGLVYKYQAGKAGTRRVLSSVKTNGAETLTWETTNRALLNTLLPDDCEDNTEQARIRDDVLTPPDVEDDEIFEVDEVRKAVQSMKRGKAPGFDNIELVAIQSLWPIIETAVINIFHACLKMGTFPALWKIGKVVVIPKGGDKDPSDPKNKRPILLVSVLVKTLEKLINGRILRCSNKS